MQRLFVMVGALFGLGAVVMARTEAHALTLSPASLQLIRIALQMHGWHAIAILVCALWLPRGGRFTQAAGLCFSVGLALFCGEVYGLALGWWHIPLAAPVGGSLLMLGWLLLAVGALARPVA